MKSLKEYMNESAGMPLKYRGTDHFGGDDPLVNRKPIDARLKDYKDSKKSKICDDIIRAYDSLRKVANSFKYNGFVGYLPELGEKINSAEMNSIFVDYFDRYVYFNATLKNENNDISTINIFIDSGKIDIKASLRNSAIPIGNLNNAESKHIIVEFYNRLNKTNSIKDLYKYCMLLVDEIKTNDDDDENGYKFSANDFYAFLNGFKKHGVEFGLGAPEFYKIGSVSDEDISDIEDLLF